MGVIAQYLDSDDKADIVRSSPCFQLSRFSFRSQPILFRNDSKFFFRR